LAINVKIERFERYSFTRK